MIELSETSKAAVAKYGWTEDTVHRDVLTNLNIDDYVDRFLSDELSDPISSLWELVREIETRFPIDDAERGSQQDFLTHGLLAGLALAVRITLDCEACKRLREKECGGCKAC